MNIYKVKSRENKGRQHLEMVLICQYHWRDINNGDYKSYQEIMNMKAYRWNYLNYYPIAITYHLKPNKW